MLIPSCCDATSFFSKVFGQTSTISVATLPQHSPEACYLQERLHGYANIVSDPIMPLQTLCEGFGNLVMQLVCRQSSPAHSMGKRIMTVLPFWSQASYRRARQYLDEEYSPLAFMSSFRVPLDCQDFLLQQLAPQDSRATAAEIASHPFLRRMAARRQAAHEVTHGSVIYPDIGRFFTA